MIAIERLRYVRLGTRDLATSVNFAQQVLGLELASHTDRIAYFRSDSRDTFHGPDDVLYSFVAEGSQIADRHAHRSRQFVKAPLSFCCWGSESQIVEFG
jgi:catechol 2,3-dioxygenase-like lactoylglutathione lyase family enzyme